jgi:hypothetical protein
MNADNPIGFDRIVGVAISGTNGAKGLAVSAFIGVYRRFQSLS